MLENEVLTREEEKKKEAEVIFDFLDTLNEEQRKEMKAFFSTAKALVVMNILKPTA